MLKCKKILIPNHNKKYFTQNLTTQCYIPQQPFKNFSTNTMHTSFSIQLAQRQRQDATKVPITTIPRLRILLNKSKLMQTNSKWNNALC
jgi:hypothetical protein